MVLLYITLLRDSDLKVHLLSKGTSRPPMQYWAAFFAEAELRAVENRNLW